MELLKGQYSATSGRISLFQGTVEEWMNYWLNILIREQIKISTHSSYHSKMKQHIFPLLGRKKLTLLSDRDIEWFLKALSGKGLSNTTINNIYVILKSALSKAYSEKVIVENPCSTIVSPKIKKKEIFVLTIEQQQRLEKIALQETACSSVIISLYTGLRIGEISGLTWSDVDLENRVISIKRTLQRISIANSKTKTKIIFGSPKTESSIRKIPIAANLADYLMEKKERSTSEFVISHKNKYMEPRLINHHFKKMTKEAKLENIHFHVLRHTFATRCIEQGIDIATLSKLLGHKSTKMTLDTYAGSLWETREKAISLIDTQLQLRH
ncbi:tyrosine-type recombinase/integrase [Enterococcus haemoperoxidus]